MTDAEFLNIASRCPSWQDNGTVKHPFRRRWIIHTLRCCREARASQQLSLKLIQLTLAHVRHIHPPISRFHLRKQKYLNSLKLDLAVVEPLTRSILSFYKPVINNSAITRPRPDPVIFWVWSPHPPFPTSAPSSPFPAILHSL